MQLGKAKAMGKDMKIVHGQEQSTSIIQRCLLPLNHALALIPKLHKKYVSKNISYF
jgi:hypothetical protein